MDAPRKDAPATNATSTPFQPYDQRGLKTLVIWIAWALASVLVFAALYRQADVVGFIERDTTRITWIIVGLFFLGTIISFVQVLFLTAEWFRAYRLERALAKHGLRAIRLRKKKRRIVERIVDAVQRICESGSSPKLELLIATELAAELRKSRFVALVGNLLITLGLVGTVFGMTMTMAGLSGALEALGENNDALVEGLRHAMSGMGVAFYTTLIGAVLGGVLLRVFSWITASSVEALEDLMLRALLVHGAVELERTPAAEARALERELSRLEERLARIQYALSASGEEAERMQRALQGLAEATQAASDEEAIRRLASVHAKYALVLRRPGLLARFFGRS